MSETRLYIAADIPCSFSRVTRPSEVLVVVVCSRRLVADSDRHRRRWPEHWAARSSSKLVLDMVVPRALGLAADTIGRNLLTFPQDDKGRIRSRFPSDEVGLSLAKVPHDGFGE